MRRSREQILAHVLKSCASDELTVSQVMVVQNLSHKLLKSYLTRLVSAGLVDYKEDRGKKRVSTTLRGVAALRCYMNAVALLNGYSSSCPLLQGAIGEVKIGAILNPKRVE